MTLRDPKGPYVTRHCVNKRKCLLLIAINACVKVKLHLKNKMTHFGLFCEEKVCVLNASVIARAPFHLKSTIFLVFDYS